ncbi:MAG: hypothetical protein ABSG53_20975 [Thermoguttaceae bacterium]
MTTKQVERQAVAAHATGMMWPEFWDTHRHEIALAEPYDRAAYHGLVTRLSYLVTCGDLDGVVPIDAGFNMPMAWELGLDDLPAYPAFDDGRVARCLWSPSPK